MDAWRVSGSPRGRGPRTRHRSESAFRACAPTSPAAATARLRCRRVRADHAGAHRRTPPPPRWPAPRRRAPSTPLHVEPDLDDVTVSDLVILAFDAQLADLFG